MQDIRSRLVDFLTSRNQNTFFQPLTADASTREYFRIDWNGRSAVACVYPQAFVPDEQTYLDVTRLFTAAGLPVAQILDFDGASGVIVQEDLGDRIVREVMLAADELRRSRLRDEAISLIARIQLATNMAF